MKATTKRTLSLLLAAVSIVAALIIYATFVRPEYETVARLRGELSTKSSLLDEQRTAITQVQGLIAQYQSMAKLGESLSLALPSEESLSSVLAQLSALSQLNNVTIQSIGISYLPIKPSLTRLPGSPGIGTLRLSLKVLGSYSSLKGFLQTLETNIRIMDIQNLTVSPGGRPDQDLFSYALTVDTYYQAK